MEALSQEKQYTTPWLDRYRRNFHAWQRLQTESNNTFERRIGIVESAFDGDGRYFEGRADVTALLTLETRCTLAPAELRRRVLLAWTSLRLHHVLLLARTRQEDDYEDTFLVVKRPNSVDEALQEAATTVTFVEDHYGKVDAADLYQHCLNTARVFDPDQCLSRLFVLPLEPVHKDRSRLRFVQVSAHMITDGLTMYNWVSHFIKLLNSSGHDLESGIDNDCSSDGIWSRLPPAQEDLYPLVQGSIARQRWFWAIMRVLRHVRKPLPTAFTNPLRRPERLASAVSMPPKYPAILDYSPHRKPPLNTFIASVTLTRSASQRLQRLARAANTSIGAGCFALVGLAMMELEEARHPPAPLAERQPFVASFPLNPRPFFGFSRAESCMLAFSDGIVMPWLSSDLELEGRFKLLARSAHRQLRAYQKRRRGPDVVVDVHSPARLLAHNYLTAVERADSKLPPERRKGINPQGDYPANVNFGGATCGVSSVGSTREWVRVGEYPLDGAAADGKDFVADFRGVTMGVRARDNEFLVGSTSDSEGIVHFDVSFDGNAIDETDMKRWKAKMEMLLEAADMAKL